MIAEPLRTLAVPIEQLAPLPGNPRRGDVAAVKRSLERFGQRKPVVARADGTVIAGNHLLAAARELGWSALAVTRVDDDDATAKAFALADNRTAELGSFDLGDLAAMAAEVHAADPGLLLAASYSDEDLNALLAGVEVPAKLTDPDAVPEPPAVPVSQPGDLWLLGPHRLLCGDSLLPEPLDRLLDGVRPDAILTDPPYGVNLDTDYSKITGSRNSMVNKAGGRRVIANSYRAVEGDTEPFDAAFLAESFKDVQEQFWFGANYYRRTLSPSDMDGSWFVWDKRPSGWNDDGAGIDDVIGAGFELIWSRRKHQQRVLRHQWSGFTARNPGLERAHPTEKPVVLLQDLLERWSPAGAVVADLFGGSGTTLIAAHGANRVARIMEIDPTYVDVAARRFQEHTGTKPVLEATGEPHDFTA